VRQKPNLLLLDEPTNHLDIEMREALTEALQDYDGALVVVAHDRHLLRATTDTLWLVADGKVAPFDGDLDDYRDWVLAQQRRGRGSEEAATPAAAAGSPDRKAQKRAQAQARQRVADARKPLLAKQAALEREMAALQSQKEALDAWLAHPAAYAAEAKDELKEKIARQGELTWQLARHETAWLELAEALDRAVADTEG
jgi:ATP-binding cassette subfamily F protein 3